MGEKQHSSPWLGAVGMSPGPTCPFKGTDNDLTLQYDLDNKVFGFWKAAGTQINGFSAYLEWKESYSAVRRFVINTPNTGIGAVQEQQIGNGTYDLQGRRVEKVAKGLYIQNGKKVLF